MPELPEVETVRCGLAASIEDTTIVSVTLRRKNLRIAFPADFERVLSGATILRIDRRAKYLLFYLSNAQVLIAHLGMTGRFSVHERMPKLSAHDHVVFTLNDGRIVIYNDARRFGLMTLAPEKKLSEHPLLASLGAEPLDKSFTPIYLKQALSKRTGSIKAALMDQALVVGVGNIYASEALFLAGIRPMRRACDVAAQAPAMVKAIRTVLNDAIRSGGSSLRDFIHVSGGTGYFQHRFNVYGRNKKPCMTCETPIKNKIIAGRSSFYCARCQK